MSGASIASNGWERNIRQQASHEHLLQDLSRSRPPSMKSGRGRPDAIIVPASRPARRLQPTVQLSARLHALLVVLCSKEAKIEDIAELVSRTAGARALVIEIPQGWNHEDFPRRTSHRTFRLASGNRRSDLSAKRNIGLVLARLHGWGKVLFMDDDITSLQADNIRRLSAQLDNNKVAGMVVRRHPDNSVVCHARRLAGFDQDVFLTGAVLGVQCNDLPLSFFPDIYNEDWFFFAMRAAARDLASVGEARQAEYDPFASPDRARHEEFGDLLAEGLYALFGRKGHKLPLDKRLHRATRTYWSYFIEEARLGAINEAIRALKRCIDREPDNSRVCSALNSLVAAKRQLKDAINPSLCVDFLDAWRDDLADWQNFTSGVNTVTSTRQAMDFLQLKTWVEPNFRRGVPLVKKRRISSTSPVAS
jgi:hypothetical protein